MKHLLLPLGLFFFAGSALAASPFCLPFASLRMNAESCDDNFAIGKKADACLSLYTTEINAGRAQMDKILKGEAAKGANEQNASFNTTNAVLDRTVSELDRLINNGEAAKLAVSSYANNLSLPEDYDQPEVTGMSTEKYLSVEPCYATPKRVVSEDSAVLELMVDDLKKAKSEVLAKGGTAQGQATHLNSVISTEPLKARKAAPAPVAPTGAYRTRDSDVTGTKEEKK